MRYSRKGMSMSKRNTAIAIVLGLALIESLVLFALLIVFIKT